jgi:hypothetical protein
VDDSTKTEITAIAPRLAKLAHSGLLRDDSQVALIQCAELLKQVRQIVLGIRCPDAQIAQQFRELLAKLGE